MTTRPYHVLFLCTANSARSIMAEAILNHLGHGRFVAHSAGSHPAGTINPDAEMIIELAGLPTESLRSKSWDEFAAPDSPPMDFVFTVCDPVTNETCPEWPGHPVSGHWHIPSPVGANVEDPEQALHHVFRELSQRIATFISLPVEKLDHSSLIAGLRSVESPQATAR